MRVVWLLLVCPLLSFYWFFVSALFFRFYYIFLNHFVLYVNHHATLEQVLEKCYIKWIGFDLIPRPQMWPDLINHFEESLISVSPSPLRKEMLIKAEKCGWNSRRYSQWAKIKTTNLTHGSSSSKQSVVSLHGTTHTHTSIHACRHFGNSLYQCWREQSFYWRWESSIPLIVFTVFKVEAPSTCLSGGWLNEWHNKKWNN